MTLNWTQGKMNIVADALNRLPVWQPDENKDILACTTQVARTTAIQINEAVLAMSNLTKEDEDYTSHPSAEILITLWHIYHEQMTIQPHETMAKSKLF